jgi:CRP-like cAMP-binding protein
VHDLHEMPANKGENAVLKNREGLAMLLARHPPKPVNLLSSYPDVLSNYASKTGLSSSASTDKQCVKAMDRSKLKPAHLRRIKSLALLSDSQLEVFLDYIQLVVCPHSGSIFREGQQGDSMYLILDGEMRVYGKQRTGEVLFLRALQAGDSFGEVALLTAGPRSASVEAMKQSLLLKISAASLQKLLDAEPALAAQFLYHLARSLGRQLSDVTTRLRAQREFKAPFAFIQ